MTHSEMNEKTQDREIEERREEVSRLLVKGYTEIDIAKKLGVSRETIVRDVRHLKSQANPWVDDLAKEGFPFEFKLAMDKLRENERGYRKMLENRNLTVSDELRIRKAIDDNVIQQTQFLGQVPTVQSLNKIVRSYGIPMSN